MKLTTLAWTAVATAATAAAGGVATDPASRWYLALRKPNWQPPAIAFPVVWTALYADIAATSAAALDSAAAMDRAARDRAARDESPTPADKSATAGAATTDQKRHRSELRAYQSALAANLILNASWSWLFWRSRRPWLAAAEAAVLAASSADLVRRTYRLNRPAGALLAPYAAWCTFATALSTAIARLNPDRSSR